MPGLDSLWSERAPTRSLNLALPLRKGSVRILLASADFDTCRRLLTSHVREKRFADGHFGAMVESGHIGAVLQRIGQIVEGDGTG